MLKLYENIRELRKKNHWTQEELAAKMGYTDRSMIAKIEAGKVDLAQSKIMEFAKIFGVDPGDLMGFEDLPEEIPAPQIQRLETYIKNTDIAVAVDLYEKYKSASPEVRAAVELLLKANQPGS